MNGASNTATVMQPSRMQTVLETFGQRVSAMGHAVKDTEEVAVRLMGEEPKMGQTGVGNGPARIALMGSLEDLSDRVADITARLEAANARLKTSI